ncbi:Sec-independent protein translocase TatB [Microbacterium sp. X-17]|uniref:Sec-independent protein translocase TatB n=1 Tax=Microbacterium sp. X-17 TaxID=3144404 RepID=UPI0031F522E3
MIFGLTIEKLLLIGVIAALLVGPERLPRYAEGLARLTQRARDMARGARSRMRDEMGPEFDEVDWRKLDPRQYDPRRIIREALLDDPPPATLRASAGTGTGTGAGGAGSGAGAVGAAASTSPTPGATPYDSEAT